MSFMYESYTCPRPSSWVRQTWRVETPSQAIWSHWEEVVSSPGVEAHLKPVAVRPQTLADVAARVGAGVALREAAADFVDDLRWARDDADVRRRVDEEPTRVTAEVDAYLAALAEHACATRGIAAPAWSQAQDRFLTTWWFPSSTPALDARAIVESPASFRRRGIFVGEGAVRRV
jgi:hypothetical protein